MIGPKQEAGSSWTNAVAKAEIKTPGTADVLTHRSILVKTSMNNLILNEYFLPLSWIKPISS